MNVRAIIGIILFFVFSGSAHAETILEYQTSPSEDDLTLVPSVVHSSVTGDDLTPGTGIDFASGSTWNWRQFDPANTTAALAIANDEVWTWGFDVTNLGTTIELTTMDLRVDRSNTGPDDFEVSASINSGSSMSLLTHDFNDSGVGVDFVGVDLTSLGTLSTGDSVVFTLAAFNAESTLGTFDLETIDNGGSDPRSLRIEGVVTAIPEPSALAWLVLGGIGVLVHRRPSRCPL